MMMMISFVQEQYHFVYKVIDEHVNRIENCPTMHRGVQDESLTESARSTPAPSVPYWHKWVSPDELPCRDARPATPTRPCRPRDRAAGTLAPCAEKRKSLAVDAEPCKKRRREPCGREKSPTVVRKRRTTETQQSGRPARQPRARQRRSETDGRQMPRSLSPCYNLPTRKPPRSTSCKPSRAKCKKSPAQSPTDDRTGLSRRPCGVAGTSPDVVQRSQLDETTRSSPDKRMPCGSADTAVSTRADLYGASPDAGTKFVPCNQQPLSPLSEMWYKLCKFCENRARDTPLRGVYIPDFGQI